MFLFYLCKLDLRNLIWSENLMKLTVINSVRTNNFNDDLLLQKISGLWKEASSRLTGQDSIVYGVYHTYESN